MEGLGEQSFVLFRIYIPSTAIGRMVGKQGSNIGAVRELTKVRVQVASDENPSPSGDAPSGFREVSIIGQPKAAQLACHLLITFAFADRTAGNESENVFPTAMQLAVYTDHEPSPHVWEGCNILQQYPSGDGAGKVSLLEAPPHALMMCCCGIGMSSLAPADGANGSSPPAPRMAMAPAAGGMKRPAHGGEPNAPKAPRMNSGAEAAEQVQLPRGTIGKVIGKGGSGLRQIREASGCQLTVDSQTSMAQISGPPEAIATAKALVHMRGAEPYPNPVDGQSTFEFYVPQALAGRIIGRGGEVLKQCRDQFQANVQVLPQGTQVDPAGRPVPPHVRYVSVTAPMPDHVRNTLEFLCESIHNALHNQKS